MTVKDIRDKLNEYCRETVCLPDTCKLYDENCDRALFADMEDCEIKRLYCLAFGDSEIDATDQTAKADAGKPKLSLVPTQIIYDIAAVREYGCNKYPEGGKDNWKKVEPQRYRDAAYRHFLAYINDPASVDKESGLPHRWHLECNLAFLAELEGGNGKA